ncbi:SDR family oxidoreductase [Streptomyces sp. C10]|uniref:SDR family oxidoreductase n=1 Tax=Streptomyces sp. C10 TaxID=531941 RepID=UPI003981022A
MPILVTTPNGTVGRYLTEALRDRSDVRFLVRSEAAAKALGKVRGEVFRGDVTDVADIRGAVAGVDRLYLAHPFAEDQVAAETNLGLAAIEAGARRIIKLGARAFSGNGIVPDAVTSAHDTITERLRSAGVPELTVLQPDRFLQNFLPAAASIAKGTLADPAGPGARGYVDVRDIAEVAIGDRPAETGQDRLRSHETDRCRPSRRIKSAHLTQSSPRGSAPRRRLTSMRQDTGSTS